MAARSPSPLHLHVNEDKPVHVHVRNPRNLLDTRRSLEFGSGRVKNHRMSPTPSGRSPTHSSRSPNRSSLNRSPKAPWVPAPGKSTRGNRVTFEGTRGTLEIPYPDVDGPDALRRSDLDTDDELRITGEARDYERKISHLMEEVGTLRNEVDLQNTLKEVEQKDEDLNSARRLLDVQNEALRETRKDIWEKERDNRRLLDTMDDLKQDVVASRGEARNVSVERERLLRKLVETEMDGQAATAQANNLREMVRRLREERKMSADDCRSLTLQKEAMMEKLADFESTNRSLRHLLQDQHAVESDQQRLAEQKAILVTKFAVSEEENERLRQELKELEKKLMDVRIQLSGQRDETMASTSLQASLEQTRAHLQRELRMREADCNRMAVQIRTLGSQLAQEKIDVDHLQELLRQAHGKHEKDKDALKKATRIQKQRASKSENTVDQLNCMLMEKDQRLSELQALQDEQKAVLDSSAKEKAAILTENAGLKTLLNAQAQIFSHHSCEREVVIPHQAMTTSCHSAHPELTTDANHHQQPQSHHQDICTPRLGLSLDDYKLTVNALRDEVDHLAHLTYKKDFEIQRLQAELKRSCNLMETVLQKHQTDYERRPWRRGMLKREVPSLHTHLMDHQKNIRFTCKMSSKVLSSNLVSTQERKPSAGHRKTRVRNSPVLEQSSTRYSLATDPNYNDNHRDDCSSLDNESSCSCVHCSGLVVDQRHSAPAPTSVRKTLKSRYSAPSLLSSEYIEAASQLEFVPNKTQSSPAQKHSNTSEHVKHGASTSASVEICQQKQQPRGRDEVDITGISNSVVTGPIHTSNTKPLSLVTSAPMNAAQVSSSSELDLINRQSASISYITAPDLNQRVTLTGPINEGFQADLSDVVQHFIPSENQNAMKDHGTKLRNLESAIADITREDQLWHDDFTETQLKKKQSSKAQKSNSKVETKSKAKDSRVSVRKKTEVMKKTVSDDLLVDGNLIRVSCDSILWRGTSKRSKVVKNCKNNSPASQSTSPVLLIDNSVNRYDKKTTEKSSIHRPIRSTAYHQQRSTPVAGNKLSEMEAVNGRPFSIAGVLAHPERHALTRQKNTVVDCSCSTPVNKYCQTISSSELGLFFPTKQNLTSAIKPVSMVEDGPLYPVEIDHCEMESSPLTCQPVMSSLKRSSLHAAKHYCVSAGSSVSFCDVTHNNASESLDRLRPADALPPPQSTKPTMKCNACMVGVIHPCWYCTIAGCEGHRSPIKVSTRNPDFPQSPPVKNGDSSKHSHRKYLNEARIPEMKTRQHQASITNQGAHTKDTNTEPSDDIHNHLKNVPLRNWDKKLSPRCRKATKPLPLTDHTFYCPPAWCPNSETQPHCADGTPVLTENKEPLFSLASMITPSISRQTQKSKDVTYLTKVKTTQTARRTCSHAECQTPKLCDQTSDKQYLMAMNDMIKDERACNSTSNIRCDHYSILPWGLTNNEEANRCDSPQVTRPGTKSLKYKGKAAIVDQTCRLVHLGNTIRSLREEIKLSLDSTLEKKEALFWAEQEYMERKVILSDTLKQEKTAQDAQWKELDRKRTKGIKEERRKRHHLYAMQQKARNMKVAWVLPTENITALETKIQRSCQRLIVSQRKLETLVNEKQLTITSLEQSLLSEQNQSDQLMQDKALLDIDNLLLNTRIGEIEILLTAAEERNRQIADSTNNELHLKSQDIHKLNAELERLKTQIMTAEERHNTAKSECRDLQDEKRQLTNNVADYKAKSERNEQEADVMARRLTDTTSALERVKAESSIEIERVRQRLEDRLRELEPLPELLKSAELRLHDANEKLAEFNKCDGDKTHIVAELTAKVERQTAELESWRDRYRSLEVGLQSKIETLERRVREVETKNTELMITNSQKEESVNRINLKLDERTQENATLGRQLESSLSESRRISDDAREKAVYKERALQDRVRDLDEQLTNSRAEIAKMRREKEEGERKYNSRLYDLKDRLEQSHSTNRSMQNYVQFLKSSYASVMGDVSISSPISPVRGNSTFRESAPLRQPQF